MTKTRPLYTTWINISKRHSGRYITVHYQDVTKPLTLCGVEPVYHWLSEDDLTEYFWERMTKDQLHICESCTSIRNQQDPEL